MNSGLQLRLMPVGVNVAGSGRVAQNVFDLTGGRAQHRAITTGNAHLDRRLHIVSLLKFFDEDLGLGNDGGQLLANFSTIFGVCETLCVLTRICAKFSAGGCGLMS